MEKGALQSFLFPTDFYESDVADIAEETIARHGIREWRLVVLTNEIHGHLGIYSTVGAKMGLKVREMFEGRGCHKEPSVISYAGSNPPVSCLNDGLQVSTGASLGHGLICISEEEETRVEAVFTCDGIRITAKLKADREAQIRADIKTGVELFAHTPAYWEYIRSLAIKYWKEWDRNEIFSIDISAADTHSDSGKHRHP